MKILMPVDGSEASDRAVDKAIGFLKRITDVELHLLNVQAPIPGNVGSFVGREAIDKLHQEEAAKQLSGAAAKLDAAGIKYVRRIGIGEPAESIAGYAAEQACELIFMGTRGMGAVSNLVMGSVATKVIHLAAVPVLLLK